MEVHFTKLNRLSLIFLMIVFSGFACNFPTSTDSNPEPTQTLPAPNTIIESPPATEQVDLPPPSSVDPVIQTDLPTVILEGGTGYIFSIQQITSEDRDIWWNSSEIIPANCITYRLCRMVSLGQISSPADVTQIVTDEMSVEIFEPVVGEGFAIEIERDGIFQYAIFRVISLENRVLTFDWVYPFVGEIIGAD